jgi:hypothetical protein
MGMLLAPGQDDARGNGNRQQQEQQHQQQELQLGHLPSLNSKASREGSTISDVSATDSITNPGARPGSPRSADLASGLRRASRGGSSMSRQESLGAPASRMTSDVMSLSASASSFTEREGNDLVHHSASRTQSGGGAAMPSAASASGAPTGSGWSRRSRASHARFFSMLRAAGSAPQGRLLYGLRVRMGVASGALADEDVHSSAVFRLAKREQRRPYVNQEGGRCWMLAFSRAEKLPTDLSLLPRHAAPRIMQAPVATASHPPSPPP